MTISAKLEIPYERVACDVLVSDHSVSGVTVAVVQRKGVYPPVTNGMEELAGSVAELLESGAFGPDLAKVWRGIATEIMTAVATEKPSSRWGREQSKQWPKRSRPMFHAIRLGRVTWLEVSPKGTAWDFLPLIVRARCHWEGTTRVGNLLGEDLAQHGVTERDLFDKEAGHDWA